MEPHPPRLASFGRSLQTYLKALCDSAASGSQTAVVWARPLRRITSLYFAHVGSTSQRVWRLQRAAYFDNLFCGSSMSLLPLFSIIIPTHDRLELLRRAKEEAEHAFRSRDYGKAVALYDAMADSDLSTVERKRRELARKYASR